MTRNLEQDQRDYHYMRLLPKIGDTEERVEIETYWHSRNMLDELRDYKYTTTKWIKPKYKKSTIYYKQYNHLDTNFDFQGWAMRTEEREKAEERWCEENQDYILEINR